MKLSEVLKDWPEKKQWYYPELSGPNEFERKLGQTKIDTWNESLTSCDREIDKEALAKIVYGLKSVFKNPNHYSLKEQEKIALNDVETIISTMPTWLKRSEKK